MMEHAIVLGAAIFLVLGFIYLLYKFKLVSNAETVIAIAMKSLEVMGDPLLSDDDKEAWMQKNALMLFKLFALLLIGGAVALLLPVALVHGASMLGWIDFDAVIELTLDWRFLLATTITGILVYKLNKKKSVEQDSAAFENRYSGMDRMLHSMAFAMFGLQKTISKIEDKLNSKRLATTADKPVFITGLPRSGTTLLLELVHNTPEFSTHTYRHMPFLAMPLTWGRFASAFRADDVARERAHGDGMKVSLDSPEAFEEALWMNFFPSHYRNNHIEPWNSESIASFNQFFCNHRKKICMLHENQSGVSAGSTRYASKNNLNVSRVELLLKNIPGAKVVLPFRDPYQHAASLLRQHLNFLEIHKDDKFASKYMADIGHFDFGNNIKPVDYEHWLGSNEYQDKTTLAFWLAYWCATYQHLLHLENDRLMFSDFDALCEQPGPALETLADFIEINDKTALISQSERVRSQRKHDTDMNELPDNLVQTVTAVYEKLKQVSR